MVQPTTQPPTSSGGVRGANGKQCQKVTPSYAQGTLASLSRSAMCLDTGVHTESAAQRSAPRLSNAATGNSPLRRYRLSTISSRSNAKRPGPFRFFDLPPELRNLVYEFCELETASRRLDFADWRIDWRTRGPALLQASKQLLYEAGSLYFSTGTFDILVHKLGLDIFADWARSLGPSVRQQLLEIRNVTIRLVLDYSCNEDHTDVYPRVRGANDKGCRSRLGWTVMRLAHAIPRQRALSPSKRSAFAQWKFTLECPSAISLWQPSAPIFLNPRLRPRLTPLCGLIWRDAETVGCHSWNSTKAQKASRRELDVAVHDVLKIMQQLKASTNA